MENLEWKPVLYNGIETNVEVTRCGRVRRVKVDWLNYNWKTKLGQIDFSNFKLEKGYYQFSLQVKGLKPKTARLHQLIAAAFLDYKFNGYKNVVDHIDSNPINNNLSNLRVVSHRENTSKERTIKSGLPTGLYFDKARNKYKAQIVINGKVNALGRYETIQEALQAYKNKLKEL
jgi:hypothetical protein